MRGRFVPFVSLLALAAPIAAAPGAQSVVAQSEMATLSDALQLVQLDTISYFTTLENLDDLAGETQQNLFDWINRDGGALVISTIEGKFRSTRLFIPAWQGPYVSYQPTRIDDQNSDYDEGTPLDPWGNPYLFFSPLGLLSPKTASVTLDYYGDELGAYYIVSLGQDGVMSGDDLFRLVPSTGIEVAVISSVRIVPTSGSRSPAYELRIRGYNFGATPGTVLRDGVDEPGTPTWTDGLVTLPLGTIPSGGTEFGLRLSGGQELAFPTFLLEGSAAVDDWTLY